MTLTTHAPDVQAVPSSLIPLTEPLSAREARIWVTGTLEALRVDGKLSAYHLGDYSSAQVVPEDHAPIPAVLKVRVLSDGADYDALMELHHLISTATEDSGVFVLLDIESAVEYWHG